MGIAQWFRQIQWIGFRHLCRPSLTLGLKNKLEMEVRL
jgi:hypothetical protein